MPKITSFCLSLLTIVITAVPVLSQTASEIDAMRRQFGSYIVTTAMFVEQCQSQGIIDAGNVQNETIEMGRALGMIQDQFFLEDMRRGANGDIFDLARGVWITLPIREDHCKMVLGEQQKVKISLSKQVQ